MLKQTHGHKTPWIVLRSVDKYKARLEAIKVILNSVDYEGRNEELEYITDSKIVISGSREIEIMEAQQIKER